jgi:hypothetical protein
MRRRLLPAATGDVSWLIVECSHSAGDQVARKVAAVAVASGLLMYDPQRNVVWGNTRPPSARRRRR